MDLDQTLVYSSSFVWFPVSSRSDNFLHEKCLCLAPQALSQLQEGDVQTVEEAEAARALRSDNEELQARLDQVTTTEVEASPLSVVELLTAWVAFFGRSYCRVEDGHVTGILCLEKGFDARLVKTALETPPFGV